MKSMSFLKGMGAGLVAGACLGMALAPEKRSCKKAICKAAKAVETIIGDISDIIRI